MTLSTTTTQLLMANSIDARLKCMHCFSVYRLILLFCLDACHTWQYYTDLAWVLSYPGVGVLHSCSQYKHLGVVTCLGYYDKCSPYSLSGTVELPNNGHIGSRSFVYYNNMEVVPLQKRRQSWSITNFICVMPHNCNNKITTVWLVIFVGC
jgi:hypothetical protein